MEVEQAKSNTKSELIDKLLEFSIDEITEDYLKIYDITKEKVEEVIKSKISANCLSVVYKEKEPIAYVCYKDEGDRIRMMFWAVKKEYRDQSLHLFMVDKIEEEARKKEKDFMYMVIHRMEHKLIMTAIRKGWRYLGGKNEVILVKILRRRSNG